MPDEVSAAPPPAVSRLADRLGIPASELSGYGQRGQTRTEHLRQIVAYAGWRVIDPPIWKELDEFLFARAMEHDSPKLLFRLGCEYLASEQVVRPGVVSLLERVAARERARVETWVRLAHLVGEDRPGAIRRSELDGLLVPDPELGRTPMCPARVGAGLRRDREPLPWMSEAMDLKKEKNFFETRVTEYQSGAALEWD